MLPRIVLLNTGERIIAALSEVTDPEGKPVCLLVKCPYILSMIPLEEKSPDGNPVQFNVNFTKWIPYSSDDQFKIAYNSVIAFGEVDPGILDVYIEKFGDKLNDDNTLPAIDPDVMPEESGVSDSGDRGEG